MHYPAHLAQLLAMQKDASDRPAPGLKDTSRTVSPRTLPYYPDKPPSRIGEPGAGPAPGHYRDPITGTLKRFPDDEPSRSGEDDLETILPPGRQALNGAPDDNARRMYDNAGRIAWERARVRAREAATILPDGRQALNGAPGAGPAPGQQMPGKFYTDFGEQMPSVPRKTLRRYAPMGRTPPQQSPAPMRDVDERMPTPRAIPFERMERLPPRRRDSY